MKYLTNSEMSQWRRCKRKWWLSTHRGLRRINETGENFNKALGIGNRVHDALAAYYDPENECRDPVAFTEASVAEDLARYDDEYTDAIKKEGDTARVMLEGYVDWLSETGADQSLRFVESEKAVTAPLYGDTYLLSKLDARVDHEEFGGRYALEHKGQPLDALVMTPSGPVEMGSLRVGGSVVGADGAPTAVTAIQDLGEQDLWRVRFTDSTEVLVTGEHLWAVDGPGGRVVRETRDLAALEAPRAFKIPRVSPVQFDERDLTIPPYTMGVLLGDGSLVRCCSFSSGDEQIVNEVERELDRSIEAKTRVRDDTEIYVAFLRFFDDEVKRLGLHGLRSEDKFIPEQYLHGSVDQRLALLQGLMDSDGCGGRQPRFRTSSRALAEGMCLLVESFGGTFRLRESMGHVGTVADGYDTRPNWCGTVQGLTDLEIFRLGRKKFERQTVSERGRVLESVTRDGRAPARCIRVAAADGLYVTEHFVVTHNTVSTIKPPAHLKFSTQFLTEHLVEFLDLREQGEESRGAVGVLWNALLKSKRTARAKGPFYHREPVRHSVNQLRSHWHHVVAIAREIHDAEYRLAKGESHHSVCHPNPTNDCSWDCPFARQCLLLDTDEHKAESALQTQFEPGNPLARYEGLLGENVIRQA